MLRLRAMWPTQLARLTPAPAIMRGMGLRAPPLLLRQQAGRPMCTAPLDTNTFGSAPQDLPTVDRVQTKVSRSRSSSLSISPGNMPHALLKTYKPTSPGRRHRIVVDRSHLWPGRPVRRLSKGLNQCAGRFAARNVRRKPTPPWTYLRDPREVGSYSEFILPSADAQSHFLADTSYIIK